MTQTKKQFVIICLPDRLILEISRSIDEFNNIYDGKPINQEIKNFYNVKAIKLLKKDLK